MSQSRCSRPAHVPRVQSPADTSGSGRLKVDPPGTEGDGIAGLGQGDRRGRLDGRCQWPDRVSLP